MVPLLPLFSPPYSAHSGLFPSLKSQRGASLNFNVEPPLLLGFCSSSPLPPTRNATLNRRRRCRLRRRRRCPFFLFRTDERRGGRTTGSPPSPPSLALPSPSQSTLPPPPPPPRPFSFTRSEPRRLLLERARAFDSRSLASLPSSAAED